MNRYRLLLDRAGLAERLEALRRTTRDEATPVDPRFEVGQLLCALLVGGLRAARGERLSAGQFVRAHATRHLLRLLVAAVPAAPGVILDDLDPFGRVEQGWPELAREVAAGAPPAGGCARAARRGGEDPPVASGRALARGRGRGGAGCARASERVKSPATAPGRSRRGFPDIRPRASRPSATGRRT